MLRAENGGLDRVGHRHVRIEKAPDITTSGASASARQTATSHQGERLPDQLVAARLSAARPSRSRSDTARCSDCAMQKICVPHDVDLATLGSLETVIQSARSLRRGQFVYSTGHELRYLFAVRSGVVKTVMRNADGKEQIIGMYGPGDALGLDGLAAGRYALDAVALQDTTVCLIPYNQFRQMCQDIPAVQQRLIEIMGYRLVRDACMKMLTCVQPVEARIVSFLLETADDNARRGFSPREFTIGMTRAEIGNYLGTSLETVSRVISALSRDGLIEARGKRIRVLDFDRLKARLRPNVTRSGQITADNDGN